jgi:hypothetical protein
MLFESYEIQRAQNGAFTWTATGMIYDGTAATFDAKYFVKGARKFGDRLEGEVRLARSGGANDGNDVGHCGAGLGA